MKTHQKIYLIFKRIIDIIGSLIGILICAPLLWWWVAIVQKCTSKGPIFFVQKRVGKKGKLFGVIKFRSMKVDVDHNASSETADYASMTTKFGRFLRKTSIDETPQLLNIFVSHMSFIGPRPLNDANEDHETIEIRKENGAINLKPGISGYAQVHGRTAVSPHDKGVMDGIYYEKFNIWLDTKIFVYTILMCLHLTKKR